MTRTRLLYLLILAVIVGVAIAFWPSRVEPPIEAPAGSPAGSTAPTADTLDAPGTVPAPLPDVELTAPEALEAESIEAMERRIADLQLALEAAINERKRAEADLQQSERDVSDLERFVEEIEERGEDPADYAEEGLEKFQPAFDRYQQSFNRLEQAEIMEETARDALDRARTKLEALKRDAGIR